MTEFDKLKGKLTQEQVILWNTVWVKKANKAERVFLKEYDRKIQPICDHYWEQVKLNIDFKKEYEPVRILIGKRNNLLEIWKKERTSKYQRNLDSFKEFLESDKLMKSEKRKFNKIKKELIKEHDILMQPVRKQFNEFYDPKINTAIDKVFIEFWNHVRK